MGALTKLSTAELLLVFDEDHDKTLYLPDELKTQSILLTKAEENVPWSV